MMIIKIRSILLAMLVVVQISYLTINRTVSGGATLSGYGRYLDAYSHLLGGTTYFVDRTAGNDNNSGLTKKSAWKTVAKVNASIFSPGDSILFKRGQTWKEELETTSSGMPGYPITFGAYGSGARPTFDGADILRRGWEQYSGKIYRRAVTNDPERAWWGGTELTWNEGNYATLGTKEADWNEGYLYVNIGQSPNGKKMIVPVREWGVNLQYKSHITYIGLHFTRGLGNGITQGASVSGSNIVFDDCVSDYNGANGMYYGVTAARGTNFTIQNSQFNYNGTSNLHHGIYEEAGTLWTIQNSVFIGNAGWGIQIQDDSDSNIVLYNYFEDNVTGAIVVYDNGAGGCNYNEIYYNIINGGYDGIWFGGSSLNTENKVYNNVIYGFTGSGFKITHDSHVGILKNNIIWSADAYFLLRDYGEAAGLISDHNCIGPDQTGGLKWRTETYNSLAAYITATGMDTHSISSDPKLVAPAAANFHLKCESPCIDSGTDVGLTMDYFGNPIPASGNPDIGIHEYPLLLEKGAAIIRETIASAFRGVTCKFAKLGEYNREAISQ